jgi:dihydropteroate synthase
MPEPKPVATRLAATRQRRQFQVELPGGGVLSLGARTLVMGILNVTPDSFSDGGRFLDPEAAVDQGMRLQACGADLIDIGAESARPGAESISAAEERRRLLPVIETLARRLHIPISVDTTKPEIGREALAAGAVILNDVSMLRHGGDLAQVAAEQEAPLILMHSRATPRTMAADTDYPGGVMADLLAELSAAVERAVERGVAAGRILVDPGLGFAKTADQSLEILARLPEMAGLDRPLVVGASRKSFIGHVLDRPVERRREGTVAAEALAVLGGAHVIRTHDVEAGRQAVDLADAVLAAGSPS